MPASSKRTSRSSSATDSRRRVRGTEAVRESILSDFQSPSDLYCKQGNSAAAMVYHEDSDEKMTWNQSYNQSLFQYINGKESVFAEKNWQAEYAQLQATKHGISPRKKRKYSWILLFNQCLVAFASGRPKDASMKLLPVLQLFIKTNETVASDLRDLVVRMAFLFLDCILSHSQASRIGVQELDPDAIVTSDSLLNWLDIQDYDDKRTDEGEGSQLKFLLTLYKSQLGFCYRDPTTDTLMDAKLRSVKKELKSAMEIFTQKLKGSASGNETASVGSDSLPSTSTTYQSPAAASPGTKEALLQVHNQSALNLKAHLEQLKGNTKKSLVLCAEAQSAHLDPTYEAMHLNNLALVYASAGKKHLALHTAAKAIRQDDVARRSGGNQLFRSDGTAKRADHVYALLHNSAILALQSRNFLSSYECMASCVQNSSVYRGRPRCWLRMAEACIGLYSDQKQKGMNEESAFSTVTEKGDPIAILLHHSDAPDFALPENFNLIKLGTDNDIDLVKSKPLLRAVDCLKFTLKRLDDTKTNDLKDPEALEAARCALAFIKLEQGDYSETLRLSKLLLEEANVSRADGENPQRSALQQKMNDRRRATASLYACEASCALGQTEEALKFLASSGKTIPENGPATPTQNDINDLAIRLAGVTTGVAANNARARLHLKKTQSTIYTSASVALSQVGGNKLGIAKQLAMSAMSLDDNRALLPSEANRARWALLYCLLRMGNREGALKVLRSSR